MNTQQKRTLIISVVFIIFIIVYIVRLYDMQIIHGRIRLDSSARKIYKEIVVQAERGGIYDRYGIPLALNQHSYELFITRAGLSDDMLNEALLVLHRLLQQGGNTHIQTLSQYFTSYPLSFVNRSDEAIAAWQTDNNTFALDPDEVIYDPLSFYRFLRTFYRIDERYSMNEALAVIGMRYEIMIHGWNFFIGNPVKLADRLSDETIAAIEENAHLLPGVITNKVPHRIYVNAFDAAHVIGYVGRIDASELLARPEYAARDLIGKTGIEHYAESYLRGQNGLRRLEMDQHGRLMTELMGISSIPGHDIVLTIDMRLQKAALEALEKTIQTIIDRQEESTSNYGDAKSASVVLMDVNTGDVLALASYPSYEPSYFIDQSPHAQEQRLALIMDEENKPLLNRAIQVGYAPGSAFKPVVGLAALNERTYQAGTTILCDGKTHIGGMDFFCLDFRRGYGAHGALTLERAMAVSCNLFFHKMGVDVGIDAIDEWAKALGLGEKTGIELSGEISGNRSNRAFKQTTYQTEWWIADTAQTAIGQLYNHFTVLQLANYAATIANGGRRMTPRLIKKMIDYNNETVYEAEPSYVQLPIEKTHLDIIKDGLERVTNTREGTADQYFMGWLVKVAGKTGTAETGIEGTSNNSVFIAYAPADNPQVAIAVVIEKGAWGSYASPVAQDLFAAYFRLYHQQSSQQTGSLRIGP